MTPSELQHQERLIDQALIFGGTLQEGSPERAMVATHVCVLASGFLENIVRVKLSELVRLTKPKKEIRDYVEETVDKFQNPDFDRIVEITGRFSRPWKTKLIASVQPEVKEAINSIVANRHLIAHGRHCGISLSYIKDYVNRAREFQIIYNKTCKLID